MLRRAWWERHFFCLQYHETGAHPFRQKCPRKERIPRILWWRDPPRPPLVCGVTQSTAVGSVFVVVSRSDRRLQGRSDRLFFLYWVFSATSAGLVLPDIETDIGQGMTSMDSEPRALPRSFDWVGHILRHKSPPTPKV